MLMLSKTENETGCTLRHNGQDIAVMASNKADLLMAMELQNQNMSMLLRMVAAGRDVKSKVTEFIAENGLANPLR
jgi:hypothetical protein